MVHFNLNGLLLFYYDYRLSNTRTFDCNTNLYITILIKYIFPLVSLSFTYYEDFLWKMFTHELLILIGFDSSKKKNIQIKLNA